MLCCVGLEVRRIFFQWLETMFLGEIGPLLQLAFAHALHIHVDGEPALMAACARFSYRIGLLARLSQIRVCSAVDLNE